jgi:Tfp pilus assembly protein FimV
MAVLFATAANAAGISANQADPNQADRGSPTRVQVAPLPLAAAEPTHATPKVGGKRKIKPSHKLSLKLSMTLSIPGNAATQPDHPGKASGAPPGDSAAKQRRLSELYAQIAETEKVIQARQRQLATLDTPAITPPNALPNTPPNAPSNAPSNHGVAGASVAVAGVTAQSVVAGNAPNIGKEKIKPQNAAQDVQSARNELMSQIEALKTHGAELATGLAVILLILLTSLGFVWYRKVQSAHQEKSQRLEMVNDVHEDAESVLPPAITKTSVSVVDLTMKTPAYTSPKIQSILPPEYEMLEEADIYLRFGHDKLAEEALREAIRINPKNPQAYLTLSRVYSSRGDSLSFLALAKQVKSLGDEGVWDKVADMGRNLDPNNTLYS